MVQDYKAESSRYSMLVSSIFGADQPHICAGKSKGQLKSRLVDKYQATQDSYPICPLPRTFSLPPYTTMPALPSV